MKTKITLLLLLISALAWGQVTEIVYDFTNNDVVYKNNKKETKFGKYLRDNSTVLVRVNNYNPLRFNLKINSMPSGLSYQQKPESFKYFDVIKEGVSKVGDTIISEDAIGYFQIYYNKVLELNYKINSLQTLKTLNEETLKNKLNPIINDLKRIKPNIILPDCETLNCGDFILGIRDATIKEIERVKEDLQLTLNNIKTRDPNDSARIEKYKKEIDIYNEFIKKINDKYLKDISDIVANYEKLALLEYETEEDVEIEDTDKVKIKVKGKDNYLGKDIEKTITNLMVKKWCKIDFSTGGFWSKLYDEDYIKNIQTVVNSNNTTSNTYTIDRLDKGKNSFGAMAFINFHTQGLSFANYGISLGTGLLFNQTTKIVLAPTFSILFGETQRVILHAGIALAQVDRIISGYGEGVAFTDANYNPVTKQYVKSEFMLGLSWNLTK